MSSDLIKLIFFISLLTLVSGFVDAQGFFHAAKSWNEGKVIWSEIGKSGLGFGLGFVSYILVVKYLQEVGIVSPEMQTLGWFTITIIGIALISGKLVRWQTIDQIVAILVICGIGWLLFRVG